MGLSLVVIAAVVGLVAALVLTPLTRRLALARQWVSIPSADRHSERVVALMGGIAIFGATALGSLPVWGQLEPAQSGLLVAAAMMFAVGLVDDRISLKPHTKLIAQFVAAGLLVERGVRLGFDGRIGLPWAAPLDMVLTMAFLVGIANAFNLLDNMDGLCAGIAAIAAGSLAVMQASESQWVAAALCASMAGACLGFLRYNFSPASIFMGDCGSLFIGMFLGAAALAAPVPGQKQNIVSVLALPVLVLMIPLLDTLLVTVCRKWFRRSVFAGGCDHTSHRLVAIGLSDKKAVLFLYTLGLAGSAVAIAVQWLDWYLGLLLLPLFLLVVGAVGMYLAQVRVYEDAESLGNLLDRTPIPLLAQHRYRRRIVEVLLDTVSIAAGFYLANLLRYEGGVAAEHVQALFRQALPVIVVCHLVAYFAVGVYRGIWRHTSVGDLPKFVGAVTLGLAMSTVVLQLRHQLSGMSHTLLAINWMVQLSLLTGSRVSVKFLRDKLMADVQHERRPVLVVGMHEEADLALRRMRLNPSWGMEPAGIITDERDAVGLEIQGTPVVGTSEEIRDVLAHRQIAEAVLVDDAYSPESWSRIQRVCAELGVPTRAVKTRLLAIEPEAARAD